MIGELLVFGKGSEWFWALLQTVIVLATAIFVFKQVRLQARNNVVTTVESILARFEGREIRIARAEVAKSWIHGDKEFDGNAQIIADFWEQVSSYHKTKAIPDDIFWSSFSYYVEYYFPAFKDGIIEFRKKYGRCGGDLYSDFENSFEEMKQYALKNKLNFAAGKEEHLKDFFEDELKVCGHLVNDLTPRN